MIRWSLPSLRCSTTISRLISVRDGKVDVVNIKQMLETFGFKINSQDVRSNFFLILDVLRQNGIIENVITEKEFKTFFKKILNEE